MGKPTGVRVAAFQSFEQRNAQSFALETPGALQRVLFAHIAFYLFITEMAKVNVKGFAFGLQMAAGRVVQRQSGIKVMIDPLAFLNCLRAFSSVCGLPVISPSSTQT